MKRIVRNLMLSCVTLAMLAPAAAQNVPKFEVDPTWPQTLPSNWIIGTIGGITVDAQDHIWINQRPSGLDAREKRASTDRNVKCCVPAPPVIEFDQAGKVVQGWGGDGPNYKAGVAMARTTNGAMTATASTSTTTISCGSATTSRPPAGTFTLRSTTISAGRPRCFVSFEPLPGPGSPMRSTNLPSRVNL